MLLRRHFLQTSALALASSLAVAGPARSAPGPAAATIATAADFAALEKASGGRLGVTLLDTRTGKRVGHRQDERFPMCSTIKWMLAAAALHRAERQPGFLDERLPMRAEDLIDHAPTTRRHVGKDLSVRDLCRTTMVTSDNPAANLLLRHLGGPPALTAFMRSHGDAVTRSDRYEPELNRFTLGDPRDTTSPAASAASLQRFVLGDALRPASRQQLADWLIDNETGDATLRAGLDKRWRVGDKTGSNGKDTRNDIGVLWPLGGGTAWVLTAYLQGASVDGGQRDAVLARVAALAERMTG